MQTPDQLLLLELSEDARHVAKWLAEPVTNQHRINRLKSHAEDATKHATSLRDVHPDVLEAITAFAAVAFAMGRIHLNRRSAKVRGVIGQVSKSQLQSLVSSINAPTPRAEAQRMFTELKDLWQKPLLQLHAKFRALSELPPTKATARNDGGAGTPALPCFGDLSKGEWSKKISQKRLAKIIGEKDHRQVVPLFKTIGIHGITRQGFKVCLTGCPAQWAKEIRLAVGE